MLTRTSFYNLRFEDSIPIAAPPEAAFAFFENMEANYTHWHPEHLKFEWTRGRGLEAGTEFYFEETIAGKLQKKRVRITDVQKDRYFAFQPTNPVFRFFLPHLSFGFEPDADGHVFRAIIDLHGIGLLGTRLNKREFDAVQAHMAEEGRNLKAILEGGDATVATTKTG